MAKRHCNVRWPRSCKKQHIIYRAHSFVHTVLDCCAMRVSWTLWLCDTTVSGRRSKYVSDRFDRTVFMGDLNYRINGMRRGVDVALERNMHNVSAACHATAMSLPHAHRSCPALPLPPFLPCPARPRSTLSPGAPPPTSVGEQAPPCAGYYQLTPPPDSGSMLAIFDQVLWFNDQLRREIEADRVFSHFDEAPVNFRPTYKLDRGTDTYDTSAKARIPGWTDRILFRPVCCLWLAITSVPCINRACGVTNGSDAGSGYASWLFA